MRILLAEDDAALAQRLVPLLEQAGYVVAVVADGRGAERSARSKTCRPPSSTWACPGWTD